MSRRLYRIFFFEPPWMQFQFAFDFCFFVPLYPKLLPFFISPNLFHCPGYQSAHLPFYVVILSSPSFLFLSFTFILDFFAISNFNLDIAFASYAICSSLQERDSNTRIGSKLDSYRGFRFSACRSSRCRVNSGITIPLLPPSPFPAYLPLAVVQTYANPRATGAASASRLASARRNRVRARRQPNGGPMTTKTTP